MTKASTPDPLSRVARYIRLGTMCQVPCHPRISGREDHLTETSRRLLALSFVAHKRLLDLLSSAGHHLPRSHSSSHPVCTLIPFLRRVSDEWPPSFQLTCVPIHGVQPRRGLGLLGMAIPLKLFRRMYITPPSPRSLCFLCSSCPSCPSCPSPVQAHLPAVVHSFILYLLQFIHLSSYLNLLARCLSF